MDNFQVDRFVTPSFIEEDHKVETSLRPQQLDDYIGQAKTKEKLSVFIGAAKMREEPLDHVLLYGLRDWERQPFLESLPMKWVLI